MSRKVDSRGLRAGITQNWRSVWFSDSSDTYSKNLLEDSQIRKFLAKSLRGVGLDSIIIERSAQRVVVRVFASKPGIVIGRKGANLGELKTKLFKITKTEVDLQVIEVKVPDLSANIVAETLAMQIEKRSSVRRSVNMLMRKTMDAGAKGIKMQVSGVINGPNSIGAVEENYIGAIPTQTLRADIDYAKAVSYTRGGTIGIKVWIYKGEINN